MRYKCCSARCCCEMCLLESAPRIFSLCRDRGRSEVINARGETSVNTAASHSQACRNITRRMLQDQMPCSKAPKNRDEKRVAIKLLQKGQFQDVKAKPMSSWNALDNASKFKFAMNSAIILRFIAITIATASIGQVSAECSGSRGECDSKWGFGGHDACGQMYTNVRWSVQIRWCIQPADASRFSSFPCSGSTASEAVAVHLTWDRWL